MDIIIDKIFEWTISRLIFLLSMLFFFWVIYVDQEKIGKLIAKLRKDKNITQADLGKKLGVTKNAVSKWERGLCLMDMSLLEPLSKILDISIVELLNGRKIENEVIPISEVDDYIRDSVQISGEITKNKILSIINKVIVTSIVFLVLLLAYLNITQISYMSRKNIMKINNTDNKEIKNKEEMIEKKLEIIKNNRGKFSKDDHSFIYMRLMSMFDSLKNRKLYKYVRNREDIVYSVNDIIILSEGEIRYSEINVTTRIKEYTDNDMVEHYQEMINNEWTASLLSVNNLSTYTSYQYRLNFGNDKNVYGSGNDDINSLIYNMRYDISRLVYLTELVMEVGEIYE